MIETDRIYAMDCLEGMKRIADHSIDAVIAFSNSFDREMSSAIGA